MTELERASRSISFKRLWTVRQYPLAHHKVLKLSSALYFGLLPRKLSIGREAETILDTGERCPGMGWEEMMGSRGRRHCTWASDGSNLQDKYSIRTLSNLGPNSLGSGEEEVIQYPGEISMEGFFC